MNALFVAPTSRAAHTTSNATEKAILPAVMRVSASGSSHWRSLPANQSVTAVRIGMENNTAATHSQKLSISALCVRKSLKTLPPPKKLLKNTYILPKSSK